MYRPEDFEVVKTDTEVIDLDGEPAIQDSFVLQIHSPEISPEEVDINKLLDWMSENYVSYVDRLDEKLEVLGDKLLLTITYRPEIDHDIDHDEDYI